MIRSRLSTLVGGFVAVTVGVGVAATAGLLYASSAAPVPERLANAPIVVASPAVNTPGEQFPDPRPWSSAAATALADRLSALPGVTAAVPDREFYAQILVGGRVVGDATTGHGWASAALGPPARLVGVPPSSPAEVVLNAGLGLPAGTKVALLLATGTVTATVTGTVDGPGLYLSDAEAARLAPGVRAIGLTGQPDAADVRAVVGSAGRVLAGPERSTLEPGADATTRWIGMQVLAGLAALAAFVSVFVVASTFAFTVLQRRRQLALLRLVGAVPFQIKRFLYAEAAALGCAGAAAGVAIAVPVAPPVGELLVDVGFEPAGYEVAYHWWPLVAAFLLGPVISVLGVWAAARRASRIEPLAALRESAVDERPMTRARWIVGLAFTGVAVVAGVLAAFGDTKGNLAMWSLLATMALVVAAAVLAPAVIPILIWSLTFFFGRSRGAVGMLARESALTAVRRTAGTAAPVLLAVAFGGYVMGSVQTTTASYAVARETAVRATAVVAPDGTPGLSDAAVAGLTGAAVLETDAYVADTVLTALGVDASTVVPVAARLSVSSGSVEGLAEPSTVVVSPAMVERYGWRLGSTAPVTLADGLTVPLRVVGVASGLPADLLMPRSSVRQHDPSALTSAVYLTGPPPAGPVLGGRVVDIATYAAEADAAEDRLVWTFTVLLVAVSTGYAALSAATTQLLSSAGRRPDFRVLRRVGATRRQVTLAVAVESALSAVIGSVLGGAVALLALFGGVAALEEQAGGSVPLILPWPAVAAVVGSCVVLAVGAAVVPTIVGEYRHESARA